MNRHPVHLQLVAVDGIPQTRSCHHPALSLTPLASLRADDMEHLVLQILRLTCESFAHEKITPWERAHHQAEAALGLVDGPVMIARVTALLRAIRAERDRGFGYSSAGCPVCSLYLSNEELKVMLLLRAARQGERDAVGTAAAILASAKEAPRIACAARELGRGMGPYIVPPLRDDARAERQPQTYGAERQNLRLLVTAEPRGTS